MKKAQEFINKQEIMDIILKISQKEAEARGVSRSRFQGIKQRIKDIGDLNVNTPAVKRLINCLPSMLMLGKGWKDRNKDC